MEKTEEYLQERYDLLIDKKNRLESRNEAINVEISDLQANLDEINETLDVAFEIFSPVNRKSDETKQKVGRYREEINELKDELYNNKELIKQLDSEISSIEETLKEVDDYFDSLKIIEDDELEDESISEGSDDSLIEATSDLELENNLQNELNNILQNSYDDYVKRVSGIYEGLINKIDLAIKTIDLDSVRAKRELESIIEALKLELEDMDNNDQDSDINEQ